MSITVFAPLKRAARAIFKDDIRVCRDGQGLRVVLLAVGAAPPPPRDLARLQAQARDREALEGMRADLAHALDETFGARHKLRHLAYIENQLAADGLAMLDSVPLGILRLALEQFEGLVFNWSPQGLACLRSKMAVAVHERVAQEDASVSVEDLPPSAPPDLQAQALTTADEDALQTDAALRAAYGSVAMASTSPG